jgi:hypothetical protein
MERIMDRNHVWSFEALRLFLSVLAGVGTLVLVVALEKGGIPSIL